MASAFGIAAWCFFPVGAVLPVRLYVLLRGVWLLSLDVGRLLLSSYVLFLRLFLVRFSVLCGVYP